MLGFVKEFKSRVREWLREMEGKAASMARGCRLDGRKERWFSKCTCEAARTAMARPSGSCCSTYTTDRKIGLMKSHFMQF
jgi:hypothetical protein